MGTVAVVAPLIRTCSAWDIPARNQPETEIKQGAPGGGFLTFLFLIAKRSSRNFTDPETRTNEGEGAKGREGKGRVCQESPVVFEFECTHIQIYNATLSGGELCGARGEIVCVN